MAAASMCGARPANAQPRDAGVPAPASSGAAPLPSPPVLVPPKLLTNPEVPYPDRMTAEADELVRLTLSIDEEGKVLLAEAPDAREPFATLAIEHARRWRFEPATRNGLPIRARIRFEVVFHPPPVAPQAAAEPAVAVVTKRPAVSEVRVVGDRPDPSRTASLGRAEVRQIPGAFGDPFRAIEIMPGVTPIVSGLPFFFIRGAPPGNVGYYVDGVRVPLLFHVGVGPSVLHPGLIDRVDLYPGGYPARYGRFSGGIVAGETTTPAAELRGEYNVRLFDAGALVEAPFADNRGHVLVGGRYSYTAFLLSALQSGVELDYWDYQARASYRVTGDDTVSVFAFGSYDYLGQKTATTTQTVFGTEFHRIDARYDHALGERGNVRLAITTGLDRTRLTDDRYVRDRLIGLRSEIVYQVSPSVRFRGGTDVMLDAYDVELPTADLGPATARVAALFPTRTDLVTGVRGDVVFTAAPGFEVTLGGRADLFVSQGASAVSFDPRASMRLDLHPRVRLLSAMGIAHQAPAFAVPVPGFQPGGLRGGLQRALQQSFGVEGDVDSATTATATVFHNGFFNLSDPLGSREAVINGCAPGTFPTDSVGGDSGAVPGGRARACGQPFFPTGTVGPDRSGGSGQGADSRGATTAGSALETRTMGSAIGLELFLKRRLTSRLGGFLSYTLSRSTRSYERRTFLATFDRTHVANAAIAFDLGRKWRAGTRLVFYTGLPKAPDPTDPGATRLPPFYRIDLRLEKRWQLGKTTWISFVAEMLNATLSKEAVSTTCTLAGCESQTVGPVALPSLGVEGGF